jgi:hypothetical protein
VPGPNDAGPCDTDVGTRSGGASARQGAPDDGGADDGGADAGGTEDGEAEDGACHADGTRGQPGGVGPGLGDAATIG